MGGCEAILKIQEMVTKDQLIYVPKIIIVSAHDKDYIKDRIASVSFVKEFVTKPVKKTKISELLSKHYFE